MYGLRESTIDLFSRAHDLTLDQIVRINAALARFDNQEKAPRARKRKSRIAHILGGLQRPDSPDLGGPLRRKTLVAAIPSRDPATFAPVCTSDENWDFSDAEIAQFLHDQWKNTFVLERKRLEVFSHPESVFYDIEQEMYPGRGELGLVAVQVAEVLRCLYESENPADRESATTFQRTLHGSYPSKSDAERIKWDDYAPEEIDAYRPEAYLMRGGKKVLVCLPLAFYWDGPPAVEAWLKHFKKRFQKVKYELWAPGLSSMEHLK
jgi:hypothetical protein